ncbi:MAG: hypothetical protein IJ828_12590, partial [Treponema sp.]|nr:hypothetical protein [Treponema sp.]
RKIKIFKRKISVVCFIVHTVFNFNERRPVCKFNFAQVQGFLAFLHFSLAPVEPFFALIFFVCMILDSFSVDTNYKKKQS